MPITMVHTTNREDQNGYILYRCCSTLAISNSEWSFDELSANCEQHGSFEEIFAATSAITAVR
jgi:hypothetical protein